MEVTSRANGREQPESVRAPGIWPTLVLGAFLSATTTLALQTADPDAEPKEEESHWAGLITSWQPKNLEDPQIPRVVRAHVEGERWVVDLSKVVEDVDPVGLEPLVRERLNSMKLQELLAEDTREERERKRLWLEAMIAKLTIMDQAAAWEAVERQQGRLTALFRACVVVDVSSEECAAELPRAQAAQAALRGFEQRSTRPAIETQWRRLYGQCLDGYKKNECLDVAKHFMSKKAYEEAAVLYRNICKSASSRSQRGAACANLGMLHGGRWLGPPDASLARDYLRKACDYGSSLACKKLKK